MELPPGETSKEKESQGEEGKQRCDYRPNSIEGSFQPDPLGALELKFMPHLGNNDVSVMMFPSLLLLLLIFSLIFFDSLTKGFSI